MPTTPRILSFLAACLCVLMSASPAWAQLVLRGDYVAARGITELGSLYARERGTSVAVTPFSTNSGIEGVLSGEIDLAASARSPLAVRPAELGLVFHPVAWDALVFIVHPSNPVSNLSLAQVRDIFQGKLDNWSQVGGKEAPIDLYSVMGPYDGLETTIRQMLFGDPGYRAMIDRLFLNQHQIEVGIQMDPDAIGMTTLAGLSRQKVKPLSIEGIAADRDSIADGRYLLSLPLFMVYRADGPKADRIADFADFLRTPVAQNVLSSKQLVPHRDDEEFRNIHIRRVAVIWERLGGQPLSPAQAHALARSMDDDSSPADAAAADPAAGDMDAAPAPTGSALPMAAAAVAAALGDTAAVQAGNAAPGQAAGLAVAEAGTEPPPADASTGEVATAGAADTVTAAAIAAPAPGPVQAPGPDAAADTPAAALAQADDAGAAASAGDHDDEDEDSDSDSDATACRKRLFSRAC